MRYRIVSVCLILMTLASCRAAEPPLPLTESVRCSVTALAGDVEYRLLVEKDSDEIATYRFISPGILEGLTYEFVGPERRISFCGQSYAPAAAPNGVADLLHVVLTFDRSLLRYESGGHTADAAAGRFRILTLSDGNVSEIVSEDERIHYYFHYAP